MRFKKLWDDTIMLALRQKCRDKKRQALSDGHEHWFATNEDDDEIDDQVDEDTELVEEVEATEEILDESVV